MVDQPLVTAGLARGDGLAEQAYTVLRDAILNHELPPGTRLSVPEIARQLEISRSPAREAIARIQHEGLAQAVPNRGAVVSHIDLAALVQLYDIREVLEGLAVRRATERADQAWVDALEQLWEQHRHAVEAGDGARHIELDGEFHQRIREAAGNPSLAGSLDHLQGQIRLAMATTSRRGGGMPQAIAEHRAILDAIRSGDGAVAERVAREHIARLRESLHAAVDEHDDHDDHQEQEQR
ncbi:GntR family transcriptional regulator [Agrococcus baldri]|uniref:GntR family transcriptional regulator n=1 Tax=Agrococcus baldri TaxID=153730 RepID=A0AA87UW67_9MICO|nr:GntR family transcriptional regulator [Agrococcus baldri]GEK79217.1 GntR family transcriptional regulator [Agrococcus baldri]